MTPKNAEKKWNLTWIDNWNKVKWDNVEIFEVWWEKKSVFPSPSKMIEETKNKALDILENENNVLRRKLKKLEEENEKITKLEEENNKLKEENNKLKKDINNLTNNAKEVINKEFYLWMHDIWNSIIWLSLLPKLINIIPEDKKNKFNLILKSANSIMNHYNNAKITKLLESWNYIPEPKLIDYEKDIIDLMDINKDSEIEFIYNWKTITKDWEIDILSDFNIDNNLINWAVWNLIKNSVEACKCINEKCNININAIYNDINKTFRFEITNPWKLDNSIKNNFWEYWFTHWKQKWTWAWLYSIKQRINAYNWTFDYIENTKDKIITFYFEIPVISK